MHIQFWDSSEVWYFERLARASTILPTCYSFYQVFSPAFRFFCALHLTLLSSLSNSRVLLSRAQITPHKNTSVTFSSALSLGILTLPVLFGLAALCGDSENVRGNIWSLSGTQVCWSKVLNLVITLVIMLLCFIHKGHVCKIHSKAFSGGQRCGYGLSRHPRWKIFRR